MSGHVLQEDFINNCLYRIDESSRMVNICFNELSDDQLWKKPNSSGNSIGNLVLHLCGNIRQYAISSLGNRPDVRNRGVEFEEGQNFSKIELLSKLMNTVKEAKGVIFRVSKKELLRKRSVQGFDLSGSGIIIHVTEHYSYHTGQIALLTKLWKNQDLGFYDNFDLNIKNDDQLPG
ncbi:MAG: DinB family protein [Bacteroidota bacterium]